MSDERVVVCKLKQTAESMARQQQGCGCMHFG